MAIAGKFTENELDIAINHISDGLDTKIEAYLIGGLAMIKHASKISTKDVDIVFKDRSNMNLFIEATLQAGFRKHIRIESEYQGLETSAILVNDSNVRFDVFLDKVCNCLVYSDTMAQRANIVRYGENIIFYCSSIEDIFLFKSITDRPADLDDMVALIQLDLDWKVIENEIRAQPESWRWITRLYLRMIELKSSFSIVSPLLRDMQTEAEISAAIGILLAKLDDGPLKQKTAMQTLKETDDIFFQSVMDRMLGYKLVTVGENNEILRKTE